MATAGIVKSKTEARQLLDTNSLYINNCKIKEFDLEKIQNDRLLLRIGKKNYNVIMLE